MIIYSCVTLFQGVSPLSEITLIDVSIMKVKKIVSLVAVVAFLLHLHNSNAEILTRSTIVNPETMAAVTPDSQDKNSTASSGGAVPSTDGSGSAGKKPELKGVESSELSQSLFNNFSLDTGFILLANTSIDPTNNSLVSSDDNQSFYIRFSYDDIWAWKVDDKSVKKANEFKRIFKDYCIDSEEFLNLRTNIGYYTGSSDNSNLKASSIVGSSDFGFEFAPSINLFTKTYHLELRDKKDQFLPMSYATSLGLGFSFSSITDTDSFDIRKKLLFGPVFSWAGKEGIKPSFIIQAGPTWIDSVRALPGQVSVDVNGVPTMVDRYIAQKDAGGNFIYDFEYAFGIEMDTQFQVSKSVKAKAGVNLYMNDEIPNAWNAFLALEVDVQVFKKLFE